MSVNLGASEMPTPDASVLAWDGLRVAVLIPCYNESVTIYDVVIGFRLALPDDNIFVYDNNSNDDTISRAQAAGAIVRTEPLQGKGNVVRRMFADIEADAYILVDGDGTYDSDAAPLMLRELVDQGLDMVTATRVHENAAAYRPGHQFGNRLLTGLARQIFGNRISDMLSGYRAFSRRFVKSFPALSKGFETETEFTVHALELTMPIGEVSVRYSERPPNSASKLNTFRDGFRILWMIIALLRNERPLRFFGLIGVLCFVAGFTIAIPVFIDYARTGLVPRLPTAVLATGLVIIAVLSIFTGLILHTVTTGRREMKRLAYLAIPGLAARS